MTLPAHSSPSDDTAPRRQRLSELMDGEASAAQARGLLAVWRDDPQVRSDWHAWHVAGDVMRSADAWTSGAGRGDAAFLAALRQRLAEEPVPLAPAPLRQRDAASHPVKRPLMRRVMAPMAMAAGFVAVAGVLVVLRAGGSDADPAGGTLAAGPGNVSTGVLADGRAKVLRDARLDRYLSAHRPAVTTFDAVEAAGGPTPVVLEQRRP